MRMWLRAWLCGLAVLAGGLTTASALAEDEADATVGTLNLVFENDIFFNTDRNYTNGVRLSWVTAPDATPDLAWRAVQAFPLFPAGGRVRTSYAIGQNMYSPSDITLRDPPLDDHPYAGWLYGTVGLISETGDQLDQIGVTIGVVGPASLAEQTQRLVHEIVGADDPRGWHTQLHNEPGIVLTYQRSWRRLVARTLLTGLEYDVTPHLGGALGNVFTYANAGVTLRIGENLPLDYGPPRIQPSLPGSGFFIPRNGFGWYFFAGAEGRAVARNIFLDGNSYQDSRRVRREPFVGDLQYGFALAFDSIRLSYTRVLRTREFATQRANHDFGAISLSIRF